MDKDDPLIQEFLQESREHLATIESDLLAIEEGGADLDDQLVNKVFRAAHSIKGGAGFCDLDTLAELAHHIESVLQRIRAREMVPTPEAVNILLISFDCLREMVNDAASGHERAIGDLVRSLTELATSHQAKPGEPEAPAPLPESAPALPRSEKLEAPTLPPELSQAPPPPMPEAEPLPATLAATLPAAPPQPAETADTTLRVSLSVLEKLMNLAGEMVLARNQLLEAISSQDERAILAGGHRIDLVTSELQENIMLTRMQPMGNVLERFPRVVRDLSRELGKEITLVIEGKDVELDRTILEGLSDPLTHMVRNSVDHGIELPAERERKGKERAGTLKIRVFHEAGQVVVEIKDDGRGLDIDRIAGKALEKGLVTANMLRTMSEKEKMALIFLPGLSTADKVSNLSGRGVGMDVVRINLEKLGGTVEIESKPDLGTSFLIKLPLTMAIVPSLLVSVGSERFAIPQVNVAELIRLAPDQAVHRIETIGDTEVLLLRGELIPLVRLAEILGIEPKYRDPATAAEFPDRRRRLSDRRSRHLAVDANSSPDAPLPRRGQERRVRDASYLNIVIVNAGLFRYGIGVETLHDTVEIVVKPLGRHLKHLRDYAGATILGDGGVALILDVVSLANLQGMTSQGGTARASELAEEHVRPKHSFLLFQNGPGEACAVPLEQVARVETLDPSQVEQHAGRPTMHCRGGSLPLIALGEVTSLARLPRDKPWVVIVFSQGGREVGLLGTPPVETLETDVDIDQVTHQQPGVAGSAILRGTTTMVLDIHELASAAIPYCATTVHPVGEEGPTLLLAEDSDFFRRQVQKYLEGDGYKVIAGEDGEVAWQKLLAHADEIRAVVTDIEMPHVNGFDLLQRIRSNPRFAGLPVLALTTLAGEDDIERGRAAGFDEYKIKLDKEGLLDSLHRFLPPFASLGS